jgi:hypothetical protein
MIKKTEKRNLHVVAVTLILGLVFSTLAFAHSITAVTGVGNFIFAGAAVPPIPGMTTALFPNPAGARFIVTFTAECAVNAAAGNTTAWTDVDILVLNAAGGVVQVLPPTAGNLGAFCSSDGSAGLSGWQSNTVDAIGGPGLPAGNYRIQVRARLNNGATQASYGERTLIVSR